MCEDGCCARAKCLDYWWWMGEGKAKPRPHQENSSAPQPAQFGSCTPRAHKQTFVTPWSGHLEALNCGQLKEMRRPSFQQALDEAQRHNPVHRQVEHWVKALKNTTFAQRRAENQPDRAGSPAIDSFGMNFAVQCLKKSILPRAMPRAVSGLTCPACCSRVGLQLLAAPGTGRPYLCKVSKTQHCALSQDSASALTSASACRVLLILRKTSNKLAEFSRNSDKFWNQFTAN